MERFLSRPDAEGKVKEITPEQRTKIKKLAEQGKAADAEVEQKQKTLFEKLNSFIKGFFKDESSKIPPPTKGTEGSIFNKAYWKQVDKTREEATKSNEDAVGAIWNLAKTKYLDRGFKGSFLELVQKIADDTGFSRKQVAEKLKGPEGVEKLANELFVAMAKRRQVRLATESWLHEQKQSKWYVLASKVPNFEFVMKIAGHGPVTMNTHAGVNVFHPQRVGAWFSSYLQAWKMAYSHKNHEIWISDIIAHKGKDGKPDYAFARRCGVACDPEKFYEDYQNSMAQGAFAKLNLLTGKYGVDALKQFRLDVFSKIWASAPESLRLKEDSTRNEALGKVIAEMVNHASGATKWAPSKSVSWLLFAPRLLRSQWEFLIGDSTKMAATLATEGAKRVTMKSGDFKKWQKDNAVDLWKARKQFNERAWIGGVYFASLLLNQAYLSWTGSDQKINFTDFRRSDFWSYKIAGRNIGVLSSMLGIVRLLGTIYSDARGPQTKLEKSGLESRAKEVIGDAGQYIVNKASPFSTTMFEMGTGSDPMGSPLPWSQDEVSKRLQKKGTERLGWTETVAEGLAPIPVEEGLKDMWMSQGMDYQQASMFEKVLLNAEHFARSAVPAATDAIRNKPDVPPAAPPHKEPFPIHAPGLRIKKFSQGDILQRGGKSYMVTDFDTDGEPLVEEVHKAVMKEG
jgi:hypothetical protein